MNGKINIGQYIPTNSVLHKLDPRIKIVSLVFMLVALFIIPISTEIKYLIMMGAMLIVSLVLNVLAKIPIKRFIRGLKPLMFLLTFTFMIQLFTINTGKEIFKNPLVMNINILSVLAMIVLLFAYNLFKKHLPFRTLFFFGTVFLLFYLQYVISISFGTTYNFNPTYDGVIRGLFLFVRIMITVLLTSLLTFTTMTTDLNYGIEMVLSPLKVIKVPVEVFAMMLALILRYIPTLLFESEKIMKAQASRGLDFKESKLKEKITQIIALLIPIFLISITRAEELSDAMEARGYVIGAKRSRIDEHSINAKDLIALFTTFIIAAVVILFRFVF